MASRFRARNARRHRQQLLEQVKRMIAESGTPESVNFDPEAWLDWWLAEPLPALGYARPWTVLRLPGGYGQVSALLAMIQSGAYA